MSVSLGREWPIEDRVDNAAFSVEDLPICLVHMHRCDYRSIELAAAFYQKDVCQRKPMS